GLFLQTPPPFGGHQLKAKRGRGPVGPLQGAAKPAVVPQARLETLNPAVGFQSSDGFVQKGTRQPELGGKHFDSGLIAARTVDQEGRGEYHLGKTALTAAHHTQQTARRTAQLTCYRRHVGPGEGTRCRFNPSRHRCWRPGTLSVPPRAPAAALGRLGPPQLLLPLLAVLDELPQALLEIRGRPPARPASGTAGTTSLSRARGRDLTNGQTDAALVQVDHAHLDHVVFLQVVLDVLDVTIGHLGNVDKSRLPVLQLNEGSEIGNPGDSPLEDGTDLNGRHAVAYSSPMNLPSGNWHPLVYRLEVFLSKLAHKTLAASRPSSAAALGLL